MTRPLTRVPDMLAVGEVNRPEFSGLASYWSQQADHWLIRSSLEDPWEGFPSVVLLLHSRPGQFSPESIAKFRQSFPLARIFSIEGPWLAGAGRTMATLPGVERMAWHQWPHRLVRRLQLATGPLLPFTTTGIEQIIAETALAESLANGPSSQQIAVSASNYDDFEQIAACCRGFGHEAVWYQQSQPFRGTPRLAVWVGFSLQTFRGESPIDFARSVGPARIVWSLESVQVEDFQRVADLGSSVIVSRPMLLEDLRLALEYPLPPAVAPLTLSAIPR